jgi:hypothetical protein
MEKMEKQQKRRDLIAQYKDMKRIAGVYRIINMETGIYYLGHSADIQGIMNKFEFGKKIGSYGTLPLIMTKDLKQYGFESFRVETLEILDVKPEMTEVEIKKELKLLESMWREANGIEKEY